MRLSLYCIFPALSLSLLLVSHYKGIGLSDSKKIEGRKLTRILRDHLNHNQKAVLPVLTVVGRPLARKAPSDHLSRFMSSPEGPKRETTTGSSSVSPVITE